MVEHRASPARAAPRGTQAGSRDGAWPVLVISIAAVVSAVVLAHAVPNAGPEVLLPLLAGFAILGVFLLLGLATGRIRLGEPSPISALVRAATASLDAGVLVTDRNGDAIYVNNDLARQLGCVLGGLGPADPNSDVTTSMGQALFGLIRAAERGDTGDDLVEFRAAGETRWLQIETRPLRGPDGAKKGRGHIVWHVTDCTREKGERDNAIGALRTALALYERAPVGLLTAAASGSVTHINQTFARWLGSTPEALITRDLRLEELVPADGLELLAARSSQDLAVPPSLEFDFMREDGGILPVRVLAGMHEGELSLAVLNREEDEASLHDEALAEVRFARFFRSAPFGIATAGGDGRLISANAAFARMMLDGASGAGQPAIEALARGGSAEARAAIETGLKQALDGKGKIPPVDIAMEGNKERARRIYINPLAGPSRAREAAIIYTIDSSEQKALEAKLTQSQKMDAVGKLAGGIAHDFNNVLTVIIGYSDLLLQKHKPSDPAHQEIMNIKSSAARAAAVVRKLLAFSHQQTMEVEVIGLGELLTDLAPLLRQSIGEKIELKIPAGRDLWAIKADKTQLEHVVINLVVNARDALPGGGKITISTRNITERESQRLGHVALPRGEHVLIEVVDTGTGMTPEVMTKIFEPFFTTKPVGKGTGLGLATVYGIVKQSGGLIVPESAIGKGTAFRIYLPRHQGEGDDELAAPKARKKAPPADLTGTGRVLLVEDEDMVRGFAAIALKSRGYEVIEASTGSEALAAMEKNKGRIDIVISDVVMPEMDGPTLLKELRKKNPGLKIIFVSGYPNDAFRASLDEDEQFAFLPKPFTLPQLAGKVKEELSR